MWHGVRVTTLPTAAPFTVAQAKLFLRETEGDQDTLIGEFIDDAVAFFDGPDGIGIAVLPQVWTKAFDCFAPVMTLPGAPVTSVVSVKYLDVDGVEQTIDAANYRLDATAEPARLRPAVGSAWPVAQRVDGAVQVEYGLGYADADAIPRDIRAALRLMIGHLHLNREAIAADGAEVLPFGVETVMKRHRRGWAAA